MATDSAEPPEGFDDGGSTDYDETPSRRPNSTMTKCSAGKSWTPRLAKKSTAGGIAFGSPTIRGVVEYSGEDRARARFFNADFGVGDEVWIHKQAEKASLSSDDGSYYPTEYRVR